MRRQGHLFDAMVGFGSLRDAALRASRGKRLSRDAAGFLAELEREILALQRELVSGTYRPGPYRTFMVLDRKERLISAAPFRDRVVHHAMCAVMEPAFERHAIAHSFACRPGRGTSAALAAARRFARSTRWFLKMDVKKFFETLDHEILKGMLRRLFKDRRLLEIADRFIDAGAPECPPGRGLPIGNLTTFPTQ